MKRSWCSGSFLVVLSLFIFAAPAAATTLWYNGDFNGVDSWTNGTYVAGQPSIISRVYDDFIVPVGGWHVTEVWSNNLLSGNFTQAEWSIRSGVSAGNGGTLVASGTGSFTPVATGRSGFGNNEYTVKVTGLDIFLAQGTYWLSVAPINANPSASDVDSITTTSGANAVGSHPATMITLSGTILTVARTLFPSHLCN